MARLRNKKFYSLAELNQTIKVLLLELNQRKLQKLNATRQSLFEKLDQPALKSLPEKPFEYARYYHRKIQADYHIEIDAHHYSVPYNYVGKHVDVRVTQNVVEVLFGGCRIAIHQRIRKAGKTSVEGHMPKPHKHYLQWNKEYCLKWAYNIGPSTVKVVKKIINRKSHQDQVRRACLGLSKLAKHFGNNRLEAACLHALDNDVCYYKSIAKILENNIDCINLNNHKINKMLPIEHSNIRGSAYYG